MFLDQAIRRHRPRSNNVQSWSRGLRTPSHLHRFAGTGVAWFMAASFNLQRPMNRPCTLSLCFYPSRVTSIMRSDRPCLIAVELESNRTSLAFDNVDRVFSMLRDLACGSRPLLGDPPGAGAVEGFINIPRHSHAVLKISSTSIRFYLLRNHHLCSLPIFAPMLSFSTTRRVPSGHATVLRYMI